MTLSTEGFGRPWSAVQPLRSVCLPKQGRPSRGRARLLALCPGSAEPDVGSMPTITALWVYPVKGCKGVKAEQAAVRETGLLFDRTWLIVTDPEGEFVTQREKKVLTQIETHLPADVIDGAAPGEDTYLTLSAPGADPLRIPLQRPQNGELRKVKCWDWTGLAQDEGDAAAKWLSEVVKKPCRLVRYAGEQTGGPEAAATDGQRRLASREYFEGHEKAFSDGAWARQHEIAFPDALPILLANEGSLADLNKRLAAPVPLNRFRPNIVVGGTTPWAEDTWAELRVPRADLSLISAMPCSRCSVTTIDQATGKASPEPYRTLSKFRSGEALGWARALPSWKRVRKEVYFGWNLVVPARRAKQGLRGKETRKIRTGDDVEVTRVRPAIGSNSSLGLTLLCGALAVAAAVPAVLYGYLQRQQA